MPHLERDRWVLIWGDDPLEWLLTSEEAPARWVALTGLLERPEDDPDVIAARAAAVSSPMVQELIAGLPAWGTAAVVPGHDSPAYLPNRLHLLADLGVRGGDDERVERALDALGGHQTDAGRFLAWGKAPRRPDPLWGTLPCDTHAIAEVLIRYGRAGRPAARQALARMAADLADTDQGPAWTCIPDPAVGFRGPGRKGEVCPQVSLEALRAFSRLPEAERPDGLIDAANTLLDVWRDRGSRRPYMFGHGFRFKTVKWPPHWYGAYWVLDTLGRLPALWGPGGDPEAARSTAELVACVVAYNVGPSGRVTPGSVYRGFEGFSFGQKKVPSPTATALLAQVVHRFADLAPAVAGVDVLALAGARGGTGTPRPPAVLRG